MATKYLTQEFDIKVAIENVSQMQGIATDIDYDPLIIEPVDIDLGTTGTQLQVTDYGFLPGATLLANVATDPQGNEIPGKIVVGLNLPTSPATGSGDIFSVRFKAVGIGTTQITMTNRALFDIVGEIPATWNEDSADIIQMAIITLTVE